MKIKKEKLQSLCIKTLSEEGPLTAHEIAKLLKKKKLVVYGARQEVAPRLTELAYKGRIFVVGTTFDRETKKNVSVYGLSDE